ncbi:hypothetical protein AAFF_G00287080 [Aldrovandia affinis]|uniref:Uncharacterized protein n=1 Tax=Aldrovandia affinis TaxID=143900 RepID=A0AAD7TAP5_9TELE|nr:hypothetical protein AAFF_G00287080 [Aldrovandia affinis]
MKFSTLTPEIFCCGTWPGSTGGNSRALLPAELLLLPLWQFLQLPLRVLSEPLLWLLLLPPGLLHHHSATSQHPLCPPVCSAKRAYDQHCKGQAFKPGDRVWIHCPVLKKGLSPKLQLHWCGPGEVLGRLSEVTYCVRMPTGGTWWCSTKIDLRPTTHSPQKTQLADRKVAALSPQHHRQQRRRHNTPPVDPLGNGGYQAT